MAGDYTRFTFKADKHYSGVLKQQGRVSLDADRAQSFIDAAQRSHLLFVVEIGRP